MLDRRKYVVVHASSRDRYLVARSLVENDLLTTLVTDDYVLRFLLGKNRSLPLSKVSTSYRALLYSLLFKVFKAPSLQLQKDKYLSLKAAHIANKTRSNLISYSYYGMPGFSKLDEGLKKILFQVHPHPKYVKKLFVDEIQLVPLAADSLLREHEMTEDAGHFADLNNESLAADLLLCASSFTAKTLAIELGINHINVLPYGVDSQKFSFKQRTYEKGQEFRCLFVGSIYQRKGIYYLSKAIANLQQQGYPVHLTLVGRGSADQKLIESTGVKADVLLNLSTDDLLEEYKKAHLFTFPSICEGFGQVILESLATGLPVIASAHTAALDILDEGIDGFILPIRSIQAIEDRIKLIINQSAMLEKMSLNARIKAEEFTDEKFAVRLLSSLGHNC